MQPPALMLFSNRPSCTMVRGLGAHLWDAQGRRYLDMVQGWAVNCLGHSPPVLIEALRAQLEQVVNVGPAYHNPHAHALAARLTEHSGLERAFITGSGAEANEAAVKLARKWGKRHRPGAYEVITTHQSFHGRTLAMSSATGKAAFNEAFLPAVPGFHKVAYGDAGAVEAAITERTVAVMVEPVQGEAGVVVPPEGYLAALRRLCDQHELLLILDEIQTGMARTGPLFAHQREGVRPDIMTLGKGLGGGLPVSAMLCRAEVDAFEHGDHGGTFTGHALLCAAACAVVDALVDPRAELERHTRAQELEALLFALAERFNLGVRGRGFLWALVLPDDRAATLRDQALQNGLLLNAARPNVLRLMPPLNLTAAEHAELAEGLSQLFTEALSA